LTHVSEVLTASIIRAMHPEGCHIHLDPLFAKYYYGDRIKADENGATVECMEAMRYSYKIVARKLEVKRPLGRPKCRWDNDIKMDLKDIGCEDVNWIYLTQDRAQ
jgi:hypothetical protein